MDIYVIEPNREKAAAVGSSIPLHTLVYIYLAALCTQTTLTSSTYRPSYTGGAYIYT